jgi:hypothetical protein
MKTLALLIILSSAGCFADQLPDLTVKSDSAGGVWLTLEGTREGESWIVQDSYDGEIWRDISEFSRNPAHERLPARPNRVRLFRASTKSLESPQAALTRAREHWDAFGMTDYQYVKSTNGSAGFIVQMAAIKNGKQFEELTIESDGFDPNSPRPIEKLFDSIQSAIDQKAYFIKVLYHPTMGFPESIFIDYDSQIQDEEWSFLMEDEPQSLSSLLEESEDAWQPYRVKNYRYHLNFQTAWWRWEGDVEVTDGVAKAVGKPAPTSDHIIRTMEGHIDYIRTAQAGDSDIAAVFDPTTGFPTFISKDWTWTFVDGPGERYWITEFEFVE